MRPVAISGSRKTQHRVVLPDTRHLTPEHSTCKTGFFKRLVSIPEMKRKRKAETRKRQKLLNRWLILFILSCTMNTERVGCVVLFTRDNV